MTKTKQARKSTRPAPVELHDEALDRATGGGSYSFAVSSGTLPSGANFAFADGSVKFVK